jgi:hypothetical protein
VDGLKITQTATPRVRPLDPLRALAERVRLRRYRDACGDWNILARFGEIFWYGSAHDELPDRIGVQVGGPRANGSPTRTTEKGGNLRINRLMRCWGAPSQRGGGEAVFVLPATRIREAAQVVGALRRRQGKPLTPEQRARAIERLERARRRSRTAGASDSFALTHSVESEPGA